MQGAKKLDLNRHLPQVDWNIANGKIREIMDIDSKTFIKTKKKKRRKKVKRRKTKLNLLKFEKSKETLKSSQDKSYKKLKEQNKGKTMHITNLSDPKKTLLSPSNKISSRLHKKETSISKKKQVEHSLQLTERSHQLRTPASQPRFLLLKGRSQPGAKDDSKSPSTGGYFNALAGRGSGSKQGENSAPSLGLQTQGRYNRSNSIMPKNGPNSDQMKDMMQQQANRAHQIKLLKSRSKLQSQTPQLTSRSSSSGRTLRNNPSISKFLVQQAPQQQDHKKDSARLQTINEKSAEALKEKTPTKKKSSSSEYEYYSSEQESYRMSRLFDNGSQDGLVSQNSKGMPGGNLDFELQKRLNQMMFDPGNGDLFNDFEEEEEEHEVDPNVLDAELLSNFEGMSLDESIDIDAHEQSEDMKDYTIEKVTTSIATLEEIDEYEIEFLKKKGEKAKKNKQYRQKMKEVHLYRTIDSMLSIDDQGRIEIEYLCKHRKHFLMIKNSIYQKINLIRFNKFQLLMNKAKNQTIIKRNETLTSDNQSLSSSNTRVMFANSKSTKNLMKKQDQQMNEAQLLLYNYNLTQQTVFKMENFINRLEKNVHHGERHMSQSPGKGGFFQLMSGTGLQKQKSKKVMFQSTEAELINPVNQLTLTRIDKLHTLENMVDFQYHQHKYVLIFKYQALLTSNLFSKPAQSFIYYSVYQVLSKISQRYYKQIIDVEFNKYREYQKRVDHLINRRSDDRLSNFKPGMDNIKHMFGQNYAMVQIIKNLLMSTGSMTKQIRSMIFQSKLCLVRHLLRKVSQDENKLLIPKFMELYLIACRKDDTYKFNIKEQNNDDLKLYDDSDSEKSQDCDYMNDQKFINFFSNIKNKAQKQPMKRMDRLFKKLQVDLRKESRAGDPKSSNYMGAVQDKIKIDHSLFRIKFISEDDMEFQFHKSLSKSQGSFSDLLNKEAIEKSKQRKKEPNKFQLSELFGYGQYMIYNGLFNIFETELHSTNQEHIKQMNDKANRKMQKKVERSEKKKMMAKNIIKMGLGFDLLQKLQSTKKDNIKKKLNEDQYEKKYDESGKLIYVPKQLNAEMEFYKIKTTKKGGRDLNNYQIDFQFKKKDGDGKTIKSDSDEAKAVSQIDVVSELDQVSKPMAQLDTDKNSVRSDAPPKTFELIPSKLMDQLPDIEVKSNMSISAASNVTDVIAVEQEKKKQEIMNKVNLEEIKEVTDDNLSSDRSISKHTRRGTSKEFFAFAGKFGKKKKFQIAIDAGKMANQVSQIAMKRNKSIYSDGRGDRSLSKKMSSTQLQLEKFNSTIAHQKSGGFSPKGSGNLLDDSPEQTSSQQQKQKIMRRISDHLQEMSSRSKGGESKEYNAANLLNEQIFDLLSDGENDKRPVKLKSIHHIDAVFKHRQLEEIKSIQIIGQIVEGIQLDLQKDIMLEQNFQEKINRMLQIRNQINQMKRNSILQRCQTIEISQEKNALLKKATEIESEMETDNNRNPGKGANRKMTAKELETLQPKGRPRLIKKKSIFSPIIEEPLQIEQASTKNNYNFGMYDQPILIEERSEQEGSLASSVDYEVKDDHQQGYTVEKQSSEKPIIDLFELNNQTYLSKSSQGSAADSQRSPPLGSKEFGFDQVASIEHIQKELEENERAKARKVSGRGPRASPSGGRKRSQALRKTQTADSIEHSAAASSEERTKERQKNNLEKMKKNLHKKLFSESLKSKKIQFSDRQEQQRKRERAEQQQQIEKILIAGKHQKIDDDEISEGEESGRQNKVILTKLKLAGKRIMKGKRSIEAIDHLQDIGKKVASTVTRKNEQMMLSEYNKIKKAIENNSPQVIQDFVQFNVQMIDHKDEEGYTLLALAVHYGRVEMVEILLKNGANPNIVTSKDRNSPLHMAVHFKFKKIQDLLIDAGADENMVNADNLLPWEGMI